MPIRPKRRVVRKCAASDYDRSADIPDRQFHQEGSAVDSDREVRLEDDAEESLTKEAFYQEERPPHYG